MTIDSQLERACAPVREDARDLIARLCRELGVGAVAQALEEQQIATPAEERSAPAPRVDLAA